MGREYQQEKVFLSRYVHIHPSIVQGSRARESRAFTTLPTVLPHALGFDFALLCSALCSDEA
jgi:hypothetical protein